MFAYCGIGRSFQRVYFVAAAFAEDMAEEVDENNDRRGEIYEEKVYDAFVCPLTKQIMRDPVTIETGYTFDREAILKWFRECRNDGRKLACPLTRKELRSTDLNPSIALRNAIDEWTQRNEAKELDKAHRLLLSSASSEQDALRALEFVVNVCRKRSRAVCNGGLIPTISGLLKSGSVTLRSKALEVLRIVAEENNENKVFFFSFLFSNFRELTFCFRSY